MDLVGIKNVAAYASTRRLSPAGTGAQTAGANSAVVGATIDRISSWKGALPRSAEIAALFDTTLGNGNTLSFSFNFQDSADGVNWATYAASAATGVAYTLQTGRAPTPVNVLAATGVPGGAAQQGQCSLGVDLNGSRRYVRLVVTPALSATSTDTVTFTSAGFFAGFDRLPTVN